MRQTDIFNVLILISLQTGAGRKKLAGIHQFLSEGYAWNFELLRNDADFTPEQMAEKFTKTYDGMLILTPNALKSLSNLRKSAIPTVFTCPRRDSLVTAFPNAIFIHDDNRTIMRLAINHLLASPRVISLGFVPTRQREPWSTDRERIFRQLTEQSDMPSAVYAGNGNDTEELTEWLKELPKPTGIIAAFDDRATDIIAAAHKAKIKVPADLAVLGIGNDEPICEMTRPAISSVAVDFKKEGYQAARELHALMLRKIHPARRDIAVGAEGIVVRDTSKVPLDGAMLVRHALKFIDRHACEEIEVDDVVRHMHVSRRLAYLKFGEIAHATINDAIIARRVERAKELLASTEHSITAVAISCGYRNSNYFKNVFRRVTGVAPTIWRQRHRSPQLQTAARKTTKKTSRKC